MKLLSRIAAQVGFAGLILLGFLLCFEGKIEIPTWLQPLGRMHPLLLHLPIGVVSLLVLLPLLKKELTDTAYQKIQSFVIDLGLILTIFTTLLGLFLAQEEGYSSDAVSTHKWLAVGLCAALYALHLTQQVEKKNKLVTNGLIGLGFLLIVLTGHYGGAITHGEDYLWEPIMDEEALALDQVSLFAAVVSPILQDKCENCHNESKSKGKLVMSTEAGLLKGGESGPLWRKDQADSSLMLIRLHLPLTEKEHMPPKSKPQLKPHEVELISAWIREGADMKSKKADWDPSSPFYQLAMSHLERKAASGVAKYDFPAASGKTIQKLNTPFRSVYPIAAASPALHAKISVRNYYEPSFLEELLAVEDQLVYLNLTDLPIKEDDLSIIARFSRLETLILNGTDIDGTQLEQLSSCEELRLLALSNTAVNEVIENSFAGLKKLENLYIWNTKIDSLQVAQWRNKYPHIRFDLGNLPAEGEMLKLNPPALANEKLLLQEGEEAVLKHNLPGAVIRYTMDGTEPDSSDSPIFTEPVPIKGITTIRAKAFRDGWLGSEETSFTLFQKGIKPKDVELVQPTNGNYKGSGPSTLIDSEKGIAGNFRSPFWLGFKDNPMETIFIFDQPKPVNKLVLSYALNMGSYIMPPQKVEIWAGPDRDNMRKIKEVKPTQPTEYRSNTVEAVTLDFAPTAYPVFKLVAYPIPVMPAWHAGAGDKGWVFSDEVLFFSSTD